MEKYKMFQTTNQINHHRVLTIYANFRGILRHGWTHPLRSYAWWVVYVPISPLKMIGFIFHSILSPLWLDFILHYGWFYNPICFVHVSSENMGFPKRSMFNKARIKFVYYILYYILYHILYIILYIIVPGSHFRLRKSKNSWIFQLAMISDFRDHGSTKVVQFPVPVTSPCVWRYPSKRVALEVADLAT